MKAAIAAAAGTGSALVFVWVIGVGFIQMLVNDAKGEEKLVAIVIGLPVALLLFVLGPLIAGFVGGVVSRRIGSVVGSLIGALAVGLAAVAVSGGPSDRPVGFVGPGALMVVLVAAGHLTGVAIRPRAHAV